MAFAGNDALVNLEYKTKLYDGGLITCSVPLLDMVPPRPYPSTDPCPSAKTLFSVLGLKFLRKPRPCRLWRM